MEKLLDDVRRDAIVRLREVKEGQEVLAEAAEYIIMLSNLAKPGGVLALEDAAEEMEYDFLKRLILMAVLWQLVLYLQKSP